MTRDTIILTFRFVFLVLIQTLLLNNIYLFGYINPTLYLLFIFLYPIEIKRGNFLFVSFLFGLSIDMFSNSGGINAAATTATAYISLPVLKLLLNSQDTDFKLFKLNQEPFLRILTYVIILTIFHHFVLYSLEYFSFKEIGSVLVKTFTTSVFTIIIIMLTIYLTRKEKATNQ